MSWPEFLDTAALKAKAKAKVKAKSKAKAKAAGKAKAAASKAPGVTSSPMKAQKAKAKSTMKKILKRPDAAEGESQGQSEDCKGDGSKMEEDQGWASSW